MGQVAELRPHVEKLQQAGIEVAVIGSGGPSFAKGFAERMQANMPIYSDQELHSFTAAQLKRSSWLNLHPMTLLLGITAQIRHPQRCRRGDAGQQGGVMVLKKGGQATWKYISRYAGDHAKIGTIVEQALAARA